MERWLGPIFDLIEVSKLTLYVFAPHHSHATVPLSLLVPGDHPTFLHYSTRYFGLWLTEHVQSFGRENLNADLRTIAG